MKKATIGTCCNCGNKFDECDCKIEVITFTKRDVALALNHYGLPITEENIELLINSSDFSERLSDRVFESGYDTIKDKVLEYFKSKIS